MTYSWLPLDNAAKIYPAVTSEEHTTVFRLSVVLYNKINITWLQRAIHIAEERYPYFRVCLKKGFFWYYLEHVGQPVTPVADTGGICRSFKAPFTQDPVLFRILAIKDRISVEFSHIVTDGTGGKMFLLALLIAYFREAGMVQNKIPDLHMNSPMMNQEFEDAYIRYFNSEIPPVIQYSKAFHLPFTLNKKPRFRVLVFSMALQQIKEKAMEREISITDYLVSVYLFVLQEIHLELPRYKQLRKYKTIRIQVPVNLRKIYPTQSMRNFSLFVLPEIDLRLGKYTFDEITKIVHYKMKIETERKLINKIISRNVGSEKNPLVRGIPLIIKNLILRFKYYSQGANQYSGVITNLGKVELPGAIAEKIKQLVFIPPPPNKKLKINCGIIGINGQLTISFGNISNSKLLEMKFIRFLTSHEIPVKLANY